MQTYDFDYMVNYRAVSLSSEHHLLTFSSIILNSAREPYRSVQILLHDSRIDSHPRMNFLRIFCYFTSQKVVQVSCYNHIGSRKSQPLAHVIPPPWRISTQKNSSPKTPTDKTSSQFPLSKVPPFRFRSRLVNFFILLYINVYS